MQPTPESSDSEFDIRARAELALTFEPGQAPAQLLRHTPLLARTGTRLGMAALVIVGSLLATFIAIRPPALVRAAIEHEYYERTLRGNFMDTQLMLSKLGIKDREAIPGFLQLARPCDVDGNLAYHLTTFFERGGMVTLFAFDQPVEIAEASGWWRDVYWQVVRSREGKPLLLVAQKKRALEVAETVFAGRPG